MDRDLALKLSTALNSIKNTVTALATNTIPTAPDSRVLEQSRLNQEQNLEISEEPEPVEPATRNKK